MIVNVKHWRANISAALIEGGRMNWRAFKKEKRKTPQEVLRVGRVGSPTPTPLKTLITLKTHRGDNEKYLSIPPAELIRGTLNELNNAGCWTDCPELLADDKDTAVELEASVDGAALAGDMGRLKAALDEYRNFWLARRTRRQVTCGSCTHFQPAPVGAWGMGSCAAGLGGILWPNRRRYCDQWEEAAPL